MTGFEKAKPQSGWESRLGSILRLREDENSNARKTRAEMRRGFSAHTEHYAYPHVYPYIDSDLSEKQGKALLRLFALTAEFNKVPQFTPSEGNRQRSFGQWAFLVSSALSQKQNESFVPDPEDLDAVGQRLQFLHSLDAEEAILNVSRIMGLASSLPGGSPAIDYYDLFRTFLYWGNGFSSEAQNVRRRILRDYFSAFSVNNSTPDSSQPSTPSLNS